ncbi:uncharacterized protein LTHEOB_8107 [Lasiodiplodia theobromae]|uniref:uncharacterized protein n=1 Tax=Lasiodiplodia theobromae TaxID=45133 RepID=UPI0015C3A71D|nr:uncharacterized protein LTHEOB_8107 [Lasiodiplodia theobromae]KAF4541953.1 hypothetical protein LTHEOB_8107 [Lasiodiplodia theobromae]
MDANTQSQQTETSKSAQILSQDNSSRTTATCTKTETLPTPRARDTELFHPTPTSTLTALPRAPPPWRARKKRQQVSSCTWRKQLWCSSCETLHPKSYFTPTERLVPDHIRQCTGTVSHIRLCDHLQRLNHWEMQRAAAPCFLDASPSSPSASRMLCPESCVAVEQYYPRSSPAARPRGRGCGGGQQHHGARRRSSSMQLVRKHVRLDVDDRARLGVDDHELLAGVFAADAQLCPHLRVADCLNDFRFCGAPTAHFHPKGQDECGKKCSEFFWCPRAYEGCNTSLYLYSRRVHYPSLRRGSEIAVVSGGAGEEGETTGEDVAREKVEKDNGGSFDQIHLLSFRNLGPMDDPNDTAWLMQLDDGWRGCVKRNKAKFWSRIRRKARKLLRH